MCAKEIRIVCDGLPVCVDITEKPFDLAGQLMLGVQYDTASVTVEQIVARLHGLKLAFHVIRHVCETLLPPSPGLADVCDAVSACRLPDCPAQHSFRVTSRRSGEHSFTSLDVEREAGSVVQKNTAMSVDLEQFTRHIRVDLIENRLLVGIQTTRRGLDKRFSWVFKPRVSLKTVVAQALLQLACDGRSDVGHILDPFCGSGTILLEAAATFPDAEITGFDVFEQVASGAAANVAHAGLNDRIAVRQADARELRKQLPAASVDIIVTNPPFGVRLGARTDFKRLYHQFLSGAAHVLKPGGRLVFLGGRRRHHVVHILKEVRSLSLKHVRVIETGGIYPAIYVMTRLPNRE